MAIDWVGLSIGVVSAIVSVVSIIFAWKAVKVAEKSNTIGLTIALHELYRSDVTFHATQKVWDVYRNYPEYADEKPISYPEAQKFVSETDNKSPEWKAVHDASSFWRYLALLVNRGFIEDDIAFRSFSTPAILGLLYPIEQAYLGEKYSYNGSLQQLYDRWKSYKQKA